MAPIITAQPPQVSIEKQGLPGDANRVSTRASLVAQSVKNLPAMWETWVHPMGWVGPRRRERLPTPVLWPGEFHV